jgi:chromosomal replication initiation ATPase DnaA
VETNDDGDQMRLTQIQDLAILALTARMVGAEEFDRLFSGVEFVELDADILFVAARSEEVADEIEERYWQHIAAIAAEILKRPVGLVMVLPRLNA